MDDGLGDGDARQLEGWCKNLIRRKSGVDVAAVWLALFFAYVHRPRNTPPSVPVRSVFLTFPPPSTSPNPVSTHHRP